MLGWIEEESEDFAAAAKAWRTVLDVRETLLAEYPEADGLRSDSASWNLRLARNLEKAGRVDEADAARERAIELYDELARRQPEDTARAEKRASERARRAATLARHERFDDAEPI